MVRRRTNLPVGRVPGTKGKASVLEGVQVLLAAGRPRGTWVLSGNV